MADIIATATVQTGILADVKVVSSVVACATIINSGVNPIACPIITCIDGGAPSTASYPAINGILKGGTP